MPGPLAVQVAIFVGYLRCGFWGAWASGWAPDPASIGDGGTAGHSLCPPARSAVADRDHYGVSPAVIALILQSWWRLVRLGMEDRFQSVVATVCLVATLVLPGLLTAVFLGAGLLGIGWYSLQARRHDASRRLHDVASLALLAKLAWFFLVTGTFTFGGGLAVVPLLQKGLVEQGHWLTTADFLTAIAVGMVTPGPVMTAATFAGSWPWPAKTPRRSMSRSVIGVKANWPESVARGIVKSISHGSVGRFLKRGRSQAAPQPLLADAQA